MAPEALERIEYDDFRRVLLFGDSEGALGRLRRSAAQAGCSVAFAGRIDGAAQRLAAQVHADAALLEVERDSPGLDPLLELLQKRASERRHRSVVIGSDELIDAIAARTPHRDVFHLCRPNEIERTLAVAVASMRRQPVLRDGKDEHHAVLQQLAEEAARIAAALSSLAAEHAGESETSEEGGKDGPALDPADVRAMVRARRMRDRFLKGGYFADPAWDMMLDLLAARLEKHRVAVSSLCIAAAVPPTTALRWIKTLTDRGVFVRCADPADGRRVYIELSDDAARALTAWIRAIQRISPLGY